MDIDFTRWTREEAIDKIRGLNNQKLDPLIKWIAESIAFGRVADDIRINIADAERFVEATKLSKPAEDPREEFHSHRRCPCEFEEVEPCGRQCSCRNPNMSGACRRCCTVGSPEQQLAWAKKLVSKEKEHELLRSQNELFRSLLKRVTGPGSLLPAWTLFAMEIQNALDGRSDSQAEVKQWPPLDPGTKVKTTKPSLPVSKSRDWTGDALMSRRWGVKGVIIRHHDSHGLSYEVRHEDGSVGHYDPDELEVIQSPIDNSISADDAV